MEISVRKNHFCAIVTDMRSITEAGTFKENYPFTTVDRENTVHRRIHNNTVH